MKKTIIFLLLVLLILPSALAIDIDVKKTSSGETMIHGINSRIVFDLELTNNGQADYIKFYNLLGFNMFPREGITIDGGETKKVELTINPVGEFNERGFYTLEYFIKGLDDSEVAKTLTFNIIELEEAFEIGAGEVDPTSNSIEIYIENKVNYDIGQMYTEFSSVFFKIEESFFLGANEKKIFQVELEKEDFKKLMAGFYTLTVTVNAKEETAELETVIKFLEENIVTTTKRDYGLIISTKIIDKTNEGNVVADIETQVKKNILSRLFTSFAPEPDIVERDGLAITYTWNNKIKPGETFSVKVKTNWLFPLIIILFIVAVVILAKRYSRTTLVLRKKVSFVKTKGGEFALKISIFVNAKKYIERVNIIDRLPQLVKLYERFGSERPAHVDEKNRKLEWKFEKLEAGEVRMLSYIIYSKIGILGKFALPLTTAMYEKDGELHETVSNRTFFITEQRGKEPEEEEEDE